MTLGHRVGKLESALCSDLLMSNSKTFSITGFAVLCNQHSVIFFLWEKQNKYSVYFLMYLHKAQRGEKQTALPLMGKIPLFPSLQM